MESIWKHVENVWPNVENSSLRVAPSVKDERVYATVAKGLLSYITVQAICNITNFSCKKFIRIHMNFILKFMHKILKKFVHEFVREFTHEFVHEFMPEEYVSEEKIWGKVSVSLILPEIFQCRVLSAWADTEIC